MRARVHDNAAHSPRSSRRRVSLPYDATRTPSARLTDEQAAQYQEGLESILRDAEALLRRTGDRRGGHSALIRSELRTTVRHARAAVADLEGSPTVQARTFGLALDDYVRHEPWRATLAALGVGALVGLLLCVSARRG